MRKPTKKLSLRYLPLIASIMLQAMTTSCLELYDLDTSEDEPNPASIEMSRHTVSIMEGDSLILNATINPDTVDYQTYWFTDYEGTQPPVVLVGSCAYAHTVGSVMAYVKALSEGEISNTIIDSKSIVDSCQINVFSWELPSAIMYQRYDMVILAKITINALPLDKDIQEVAAFINGELCGRGMVLTQRNKTYCLIRVWHDELDGAPVTLRCYDHSQARIINLSGDPLYFDQETHGSLTNLLEFTGWY